MSYRLVVDTACDLTKQMERDMNVLSVPFKITVGDVEHVDNDDLDMRAYLDEMKASPDPIRTSCPSPYDYVEKLKECEEENIFILTISSKLSGSHNSAEVAKEEFLKENPNKRVYVFDSESASAGETSVALEIYKKMGEDSSFEEKVKEVNEFISENRTFFILESLDNLIKNGRIKKTAGLIANVLNIRPIMKAEYGEISLFEMNRGFKKSLSKLATSIGKKSSDFSKSTLVISHVDAIEKAKEFEKKVRELYNFKEIITLQARGLSSGYADNGGIIIGFK
ncbi:EDD domain protein, DegV family [Anaerosphaera aminiphila DSM 21120]|uniref:EDD domain protein, DegV family n=1 Tax=Anaerosphaera aminiphila DSM 21120 TaxID=1120995 RepID=A0A1M5RZ54_9FIRM|nr:DegV family protein [Anaerosphaera aminiphila]SHH31505.1 EDD domain protein, DegV family [Anaerosphaera aminiphila DSM 21120]